MHNNARRCTRGSFLEVEAMQQYRTKFVNSDSVIIIAVRHKCAVHNRCNHQLAITWSFANINQYLNSVSMSLSVAMAVSGFLCRPQRLFTRNNTNRTCKTALAAFSAELIYSWGNVGHQFLPARRYASAGNRDRNVSVRLSVRLSVRHAPVLCQNE